ncbi:MAG: GumC family protein, partial [Bryobacteraceae bacterium]
MKRLQLPSAGGLNSRSLMQRRKGGTAAGRPIPQTPGPLPVAENGESDGMLGYWRVLGRHKLAFILITILSGVAGYFLTIPQTPVYQAAITLEIQNMNENFMNMREFDPTAVNYGADSYIQTQVRILQSETLYARVSRKLALEQRPELAKPSGIASLWQIVNPKPLPSSLTAPQVQKIMADNLKVRGSGLTRIIEVRFDSPDPQSAADILNTLAGEFIEQNLEVRWNAAQNTGEWLNKQMEDIKSKLERSEQRLHAYATRSNLLYTSEKDSVVEQKLKQLQEELSKAQGDRVAKQSKYELASKSSGESIPEVISDSAIKDYQAKLADLRRQAAELKSSLTSANPRVKRIDAQIAELVGVLGEARAEILKRMRNEYETARRRESLLENEYSAQTKLVSAEGGKAIQYNILKREVDTTRQLYEAMLQKVKEAGIASALKASNVRVVDPAKVPAFPYRPNPVQNAGLGTLAGIFLGGVFAFAREKADRTLKAPGDSSFYLNLPELGVIPAASLDGVKGLTASGPKRGSNVLSVTKVEDGEPGQSGTEFTTVNGSLELATWKRQPSLISETFRATLTSILFSSENGTT